jgi:hypothetical protein
MQKHETRVQDDSWRETDPLEDRYITVKWTRLDSLFCLACGSKGLYTQPWAGAREFYFMCITCGAELVSTEFVSTRTSDNTWSKEFLAKLRELDGVVEWRSAEHIEPLRPIFEHAPI